MPENVYSEKHHIIPKCLNGTDDKSNLVRLTAREHYIAHLLLAKIHNSFGLYSAVTYMQTGNKQHSRNFKFNSKLYAKMREEFAKKCSHKYKGRIVSEEQKQKLKKSRKGKKPNLGKKLSEDWKHNISKSLKDKRKGKNNPAYNSHWYNDGIKNVFTKECPKGFVKSRLKKKNQGN